MPGPLPQDPHSVLSRPPFINNTVFPTNERIAGGHGPFFSLSMPLASNTGYALSVSTEFMDRWMGGYAQLKVLSSFSDSIHFTSLFKERKRFIKSIILSGIQ